jgi:hypothetical protein
MTSEQLLDQMRDALAVAWGLERAGCHGMAHAWGALAASKLEQALAADYPLPAHTGSQPTPSILP